MSRDTEYILKIFYIPLRQIKISPTKQKHGRIRVAAVAHVSFQVDPSEFLTSDVVYAVAKVVCFLFHAELEFEKTRRRRFGVLVSVLGYHQLRLLPSAVVMAGPRLAF